jgi:hypothetical protein
MFNIKTLIFVHTNVIDIIYSDFFYKILLFIDKMIKRLLIFPLLIFHNYFI